MRSHEQVRDELDRIPDIQRLNSGDYMRLVYALQHVGDPTYQAAMTLMESGGQSPYLRLCQVYDLLSGMLHRAAYPEPVAPAPHAQ